jgi:O-antigen/teichoic acid export membrane protein
MALIFDFSVSWMIIHRRYSEERLSVANFRVAHVRRICSFSIDVLLLSAGVRLSLETEALVIVAFQGVASIPPYVVANSLIVCLMDFVIAIAAVVSPMTAKLRAENRMDDLREMFLKWSKVATALTIVAGLSLTVLGPPFIALWIGPSYEHPSGAVLQVLIASCFVFLPVRGVAVPLLLGLGKPRTPALAYIAAGALNLVLSITLVKPLGLVGVALGTAIPNVLFAIYMFHVACRELEIPLGPSLVYVVARSALGAVPVLGLLLWCQVAIDVDTLGGIVTSGLVAAVAFGVIWITFVYRDDPYVNLKAYLVRVRGWSRA